MVRVLQDPRAGVLEQRDHVEYVINIVILLFVPKHFSSSTATKCSPWVWLCQDLVESPQCSHQTAEIGSDRESHYYYEHFYIALYNSELGRLTFCSSWPSTLRVWCHQLWRVEYIIGTKCYLYHFPVHLPWKYNRGDGTYGNSRYREGWI